MRPDADAVEELDFRSPSPKRKNATVERDEFSDVDETDPERIKRKQAFVKRAEKKLAGREVADRGLELD